MGSGTEEKGRKRCSLKRPLMSMCEQEGEICIHAVTALVSKCQSCLSYALITGSRFIALRLKNQASVSKALHCLQAAYTEMAFTLGSIACADESNKQGEARFYFQLVCCQAKSGFING